MYIGIAFSSTRIVGGTYADAGARSTSGKAGRLLRVRTRRETTDALRRLATTERTVGTDDAAVTSLTTAPSVAAAAAVAVTTAGDRSTAARVRQQLGEVSKQAARPARSAAIRSFGDVNELYIRRRRRVYERPIYATPHCRYN